MQAIASDRKDDVRKVFITNNGIYQETNSDKYSSIFIPKSSFDGYNYITIKTNNEHGTRVHILKEEPKKNSESVHYSDYYKESIIINKGIELDIVIPQDAKCIYILRSLNNTNYNPVDIYFYAEDTLSNSSVSKIQNYLRHGSGESQKFMHWNIGNFSQGKYPFSTINKDNFVAKLNDFNNFINMFCPDCHYLLNEYNDVFARIEGTPVNTPLVLFNKRVGYKVFPRTTNTAYNNLAIFWKEGFLGYQYGVFESLKGVKNANGTLEYGTGYCISQYDIGGEMLYVMSLHAPNGIKKDEHDALYNEILSICSEYDNCILVGDFNRISVNSFKVLTDAGFKILNDNSITRPATSYIVDWVLYRCNNINLSDFKVFNEAVDSSGDLLSDHLPLSFTVSYKQK